MRLRNPQLGGWNRRQPWLPDPSLAAQDPDVPQRVTVERRQTQRLGGKLHLHYNNTNENKSSGAESSKNKTTRSHRLQSNPHRKRIYASHPFREKAMAPHSSTLAWKIPWMEEPGRLQSMGSLSRTRLRDFTFTSHFHALEKEMATHSSILAWGIPGTGEPVGLPSMGSHRVGHD